MLDHAVAAEFGANYFARTWAVASVRIGAGHASRGSNYALTPWAYTEGTDCSTCCRTTYCTCRFSTCCSETGKAAGNRTCYASAQAGGTARNIF